MRHQILISEGLSTAAGIVLRALELIPVGNPLFQYMAVQRPDLYRAFVGSFAVFLFTTPYLVLSMCFSLVYIHFYEEEIERAGGSLPPYPEPGDRDELFLVLGERHQPLDLIPAVYSQWLSVPERGLYTGTIAVGAVGSGKTRGLILPAMHQLFGYRPSDAEEKLSGIVLEAKGDLCRHLSRILRESGREADYINISLGSDIRYNPLNNDLDPYAQAFNIAAIITSIWGKAKGLIAIGFIWLGRGALVSLVTLTVGTFVGREKHSEEGSTHSWYLCFRSPVSSLCGWLVTAARLRHIPPDTTSLGQ